MMFGRTKACPRQDTGVGGMPTPCAWCSAMGPSAFATSFRPGPAEDRGGVDHLARHDGKERGRNDVAKAEGPIAEHQAHGVGMPPTPVSCRGHAFVLPNIISRTESSPDHRRPGERDGSETDPRLTRTRACAHED